MRTNTTFAAIAICASLYLTMGPAQAALTQNGLTANGLHVNGLTSNGVHLNGTEPNYGPTPEVQRESLPFNGLSQKGLGKIHP